MNFEKLISGGLDIDTFLKRVMGNEALVPVFVKKFAEDRNFEALKSAFANGDAKAAETASHTLKGMCGNLSLNRLYALFTEQVNYIRAGKIKNAEEMMTEVTILYKNAIDGIDSFLKENGFYK